MGVTVRRGLRGAGVLFALVALAGCASGGPQGKSVRDPVGAATPDEPLLPEAGSGALPDGSPFGPAGEEASLNEAEQRAPFVVLVPDAESDSSRAVETTWVAGSKTGDRVALRLEGGSIILEERARADSSFVKIWTAEIAEGYPGRFITVRGETVSVAVEPGPGNYAILFFREGDADYEIYGTEKQSVEDLIAIADSMKPAE